MNLKQLTLDKLLVIGILISVLAFYPTLFSFAETITLKSGHTVAGDLIERTDEYIKIDFYGVPSTYYLEDIKSIDDEELDFSVSAAVTAQAIYEQGIEHASQGRFKEAEECFKKILKEGKAEYTIKMFSKYHLKTIKDFNNKLIRGYCVINFFKARINSFNSQYRQAIDNYQKVLQLDPDFAIAYDGIGSAYSALGKYVQAIDYYQQAIKLDPDFTLAYSGLGTAYVGLGQYKRAIDNYRKAIKLDPTFALAYSSLGLAYAESGQYQKAIEYYQKALTIEPNFALAYSSLGFAYTKLGKYQQAIDNHQKALQINPNHAKAYYGIGEAYANLGQYLQAIDAFNEAIRIKPDLAFAYYGLGVTYAEIGPHQKARDNLIKAKELFKKEGDIARAKIAEKVLSDISQ